MYTKLSSGRWAALILLAASVLITCFFLAGLVSGTIGFKKVRRYSFYLNPGKQTEMYVFDSVTSATWRLLPGAPLPTGERVRDVANWELIRDPEKGR